MAFPWTNIKTWNSPAMKRIIEAINSIGQEVVALSISGGDGSGISKGGGSAIFNDDGSLDIVIPTGASDSGEYALDINAADSGRIRFLANGDVRIDGLDSAYVNINHDNYIELSNGAKISLDAAGAITVSALLGKSIYILQGDLEGDSGAIIGIGENGDVSLTDASGNASVQLSNTGQIGLVAANGIIQITGVGGSVRMDEDGITVAVIGGKNLFITGLPTEEPIVAGAVWVDTADRTLKLSAGA